MNWTALLEWAKDHPFYQQTPAGDRSVIAVAAMTVVVLLASEIRRR